MKPAGVERDREIELLKLKAESLIVRVSEFRSDNIDIKIAGVWELYGRPRKRWSTDISAAMELWEEMKADPGIFRMDLVWGEPHVGMGDSIERVKTGIPHIYIHIFRNDANDKMPRMVEGIDFSDAISGAYCKWKGVE